MPPRQKSLDTPQLEMLHTAIVNGRGWLTLRDASGAKCKILIKNNGYKTGRGGAVFRHGREIIADDDTGDVRLGREAALLAKGMAAEAGKTLMETDFGAMIQSFMGSYVLSAETEARLPGIVHRAVLEELMAVGAAAIVIQPSPSVTVAPPNPKDEEVVSVLKGMEDTLKAMLAQATMNMKVGTTALSLGTKALEGLDNLAGVVQRNRDAHDNLRHDHDTFAAEVNDQMGNLDGRIKALELMRIA